MPHRLKLRGCYIVTTANTHAFMAAVWPTSWVAGCTIASGHVSSFSDARAALMRSMMLRDEVATGTAATTAGGLVDPRCDRLSRGLKGGARSLVGEAADVNAGVACEGYSCGA